MILTMRHGSAKSTDGQKTALTGDLTIIPASPVDRGRSGLGAMAMVTHPSRNTFEKTSYIRSSPLDLSISADVQT